MYNRRLRGKHVKLTSMCENKDPLVVDHLASDDEWYVGNENEANENPPTNMAAITQMIEGDSSSSRTRKKRKNITNSKGKDKRVLLIDEEETDEEDELQDDNNDEDGGHDDWDD
ncbi:uncharacterized protein LOC130997934 [Salvia miltiorrhiza]|uniref:uncharacterized protein LOC130997934 n=1 Tax=Salvia miltiorrhiza TaxID=226208 RepID=UPI0025ABFB28|nr:uncharacterized protein LOC130997934 [Salvia miltiorrhiza]